MSLNSKLSNFIAGSSGGFATLESMGEMVQMDKGLDLDQSLINSAIAVIGGIITAALKDLFAKWFGGGKNKKPRSGRSNRNI